MCIVTIRCCQILHIIHLIMWYHLLIAMMNADICAHITRIQTAEGNLHKILQYRMLIGE